MASDTTKFGDYELLIHEDGFGLRRNYIDLQDIYTSNLVFASRNSFFSFFFDKGDLLQEILATKKQGNATDSILHIEIN